MEPQNLSRSVKVLFLFVVGLFALALITANVSTTAQSSQSKRQLDDRVPGHLPIKIKIKKEKEEGFQDLNNEHWPRDFELEVKNTGDRPIYALSLVWELTDVRAPDGNIYGATLNYGRTVPGETPKPEDVPIQPGETHVFKLSKPTLEGLESFAKENHLTLKNVMVWFNFLCFGDGACLEGPEGKDLGRKKAAAFYSPNKGDPGYCKPQSRQRDPSLQFGFSLVPASFGPANFLLGAFSTKDPSTGPDICCPGTSCSKTSCNVEGVTAPTPSLRLMTWSLVSQRAVAIPLAFVARLSPGQESVTTPGSLSHCFVLNRYLYLVGNRCLRRLPPRHQDRHQNQLVIFLKSPTTKTVPAFHCRMAA